MRSTSISMKSEGYNVGLVIPTGIGAKIGGYAGDALPIARLLSGFVGDKGYVITHPNVVNGAMLYHTMKNVLYVEGLALDEFAQGEIGLQPITKKCQKVGLLLDKGIEDSLRIRHIQVANAAKATLGINVQSTIITSDPVCVEIDLAPSGASWGRIRNQDTLIDGARQLIQQGCTAIAVVVRFPEDDEIEANSQLQSSQLFDAYRQGNGVDAIAGVEAIISHLITKTFHVPCAHAPAFSPMEPDANVSPKSCAEELGYTFLPCVIANLHKAPNLIPIPNQHQHCADILTTEDVDAVVVPINALGGPAVLSWIAQGKLVIAVQDNETSMKVSPNDLSHHNIYPNIVTVHSYAEAVGILTAHREGILLESMRS